MHSIFKIRAFLIFSLILAPLGTWAQYAMDYSFSMAGNAGTGNFAPHYLSANRHGLVTHGRSGYLRASLAREMDSSKRFSYDFGADVVGLLSSTSPVTTYKNGVADVKYPTVSKAIIQQLYAGVRYRKLFLWAGMKELTDDVVNFELSSGGTVWSGNARPIPQVSAGIDFLNIPFTKGWVQLKGEISYGKFIDNNYLREHYNYYNSFITTGTLYHHKSIYFRSHPQKPFVVTIGGELATQFGGTRRYYLSGVEQESATSTSPTRFIDYLRVLIPMSGDGQANRGDQVYYYGNTVGQWNLSAKYTFKNRSSVRGYFEWYFDDASSMGKRNAWDGLWGLEYNSGDKDYLSGLVLEYLDMTDQSGPISWDPYYFDNPTINGTNGVGSDEYYNNQFYNGWSHFGMSNGTAMAKAPIYNTDGYLKYKHNRIRVVHLGASGYITPEWKYRVLASYRVSWGTYSVPIPTPVYDTSGMIECSYAPSKLKGWDFTLSVAGDTGTMYGDKWGVSIGARKSGVWTIGKKNKKKDI